MHIKRIHDDTSMAQQQVLEKNAKLILRQHFGVPQAYHGYQLITAKDFYARTHV